MLFTNQLNHFNTLRSTYFALFSSIMSYASIIWGQNRNNYVDRICSLQDKAIRVVNFASNFDSRNPLYKNYCILKFKDQIHVNNFLLAHDFFNNNLPNSFDNLFTLVNTKHDHNTRAAKNLHYCLPKIRTTVYGIKSITYQSVKSWNDTNHLLEKSSLFNKSKATCKKLISNFILDSCKRTSIYCIITPCFTFVYLPSFIHLVMLFTSYILLLVSRRYFVFVLDQTPCLCNICNIELPLNCLVSALNSYISISTYCHVCFFPTTNYQLFIYTGKICSFCLCFVCYCHKFLIFLNYQYHKPCSLL